MSRLLKFLAVSALLTLVGSMFWFWDQSFSANVAPARSEDADLYEDADEMTEEQRELLRQEMEAQFG